MVKKILKNILVDIFTKFAVFENIMKYAKGIGYTAPLEKEVRWLVSCNLQPFVLFDIGANTGEYSKTVSKIYPESIIYSFEPSKFTFDLLLANIGESTRIKPVNIAFGENTNTMSLYSNHQGSGMASLYNRELSHIGIKFNKSEIVNVTTLDQWVEINKIYPDFIKIDVEGFEYSVLKGALQTLKRVKAVQFEFGGTAIDARIYFKDFWEIFTKLNFSIYRYTPKGLRRIFCYSEKEESFEYMNYVAVSIDETLVS